jgi:hypothetical protein
MRNEPGQSALVRTQHTTRLRSYTRTRSPYQDASRWMTQAAEAVPSLTRAGVVGWEKKGRRNEQIQNVRVCVQHRNVLLAGSIGVAVKHHASHWTDTLHPQQQTTVQPAQSMAFLIRITSR